MREEMRAEKREKRQRKSVIYYYIAIVITAFFGTGLSLYLKGGVPFVKEGAPIFMKIAGIVVVLLLTILLYCKAQKRKWKIVGVISIVLLAAAFSWFASGISKEAALKPHTLDTPETEFLRYDIQDGHFTVKEPNPNIIKEINEDVLKNVVIHFSKPIEQNIAIKVMYTNRKDEDFSKEKKVNFKAQKGATQAVVPVEQRDVSKVKIVIGKKIGAQFDFGSIELNGNYQERLKEGLVKPPVGMQEIKITSSAKLSVWIFLIGVIAVVCYASAISPAIGLIKPVIVTRDAAIMSLMLTVGALITVFCKVKLGDIASTSVFKSGMVACICVLGVAWLGDTFVSGHTAQIKAFASETISQYPALLAVVFFLAAMLLYSQAATAKAITPTVVAALGITAAHPDNAYMLVACFAAVSALFVLPTYPTLLGAVQMDDTGTTRIGKWVFNHSFFIPGVLAIFFSVALGFVVCGFV